MVMRRFSQTAITSVPVRMSPWWFKRGGVIAGGNALGINSVLGKDEKIGYKMINARVETLAEKSSFKPLLETRRCLLLSNGFYEWRKDGAGKAPVFIYLKTKAIFAFAGLWELWRKADGERLASCTILTCAANELMAPIHNRMPVILQHRRRVEMARRRSCVVRAIAAHFDELPSGFDVLARGLDDGQCPGQRPP